MALFPPLPPFADVLRRSVAELVGTFALVFVGCGAILTAGPDAGAGNLEVALAFGLVVGVMVSALSHISGGHFNPAVTLAFLITRRLSVVLAVAYWLVQLRRRSARGAPPAVDLPRPGGGNSRRSGSRTQHRARRRPRRRSRPHLLPRLGRVRDHSPIRVAPTRPSPGWRSASRSPSTYSSAARSPVAR